MKYQRRRKSKLGEMTFAVSRFVTLSLRDKIRTIVDVTLYEMSRKTDDPEESEVDTKKKKSDATDSRWIVVALAISKGDCTHLIESPPRLELGEARWRGAVGPRTSPWLSVQLLFARRAPLVRYAASSQACRKKLSPKYTSRARATSDVAKREGERKRASLTCRVRH